MQIELIAAQKSSKSSFQSSVQCTEAAKTAQESHGNLASDLLFVR